jgi:hypothetical protein
MRGLQHRYGRTRTGLRSGIGPSNVWHLRNMEKRILCGSKSRWSGSMSAEPLEASLRQIESQGGTPCARCLRTLGR